ncbi:MAG: tetratricopeptide repeat protein, partial [Cyanobacteria bacterium J06628_4]
MLNRIFQRQPVPIKKSTVPPDPLPKPPPDNKTPLTDPLTSQDVVALFEQGLQKISVNDYEAALPLFEQVLVIQPDLPNAWEKHSIVLQNLGRYGEALDANAKAMELYQAGAKALAVDVRKGWTAEQWIIEGETLFFHSRYEEAVSAYDAALKTRPDLHDTLYDKGVSLFNLGRYEDAIAAYNAALTLRPDLYEAFNNKGLSLAKLGHYKEAIIAYDAALSLNPDLHQTLN